MRSGLIRLSLHLVPFAVAFLWFIGVVRDQLGNVEDRLFSTVFLGGGLLFLAMLFVGRPVERALRSLAATTSVPALRVWPQHHPDLICLCHADGGGIHDLG